MARSYIIFTFWLLSECVSGQNMAWFDTISYSSNNRPSSIINDLNGNIYVGGDYSPAYHDYNANAQYGAFLSKYDSSGSLIWQDTTNVRAAVTGIVIQKNTLFVAAYSQYSPVVTFGPYAFTNSVGVDQCYFLKYNPLGTVLYARKISNIKPSGLVQDHSGHIYVFGTTSAATAIDSYTLSPGNFIAKFDSLGNCMTAFSTGSDIISMTVDGNDDFFIVDKNGTYSPNVLKKFNSFGTLLWSKNLPTGVNVYSDQGGFLYLLGGFYSSSLTLGSTTLYNSYSSSSGIPAQWFIAKMDQNGNYLWAHIPADSVSVLGFNLNNDKIYLTGYTGFNAGEAYDHKLYVMTYDTSGNFISERTYLSDYTGTCLASNGQALFIAGAESHLNYYKGFIAKININVIQTSTIEHSHRNETDVLSVFPNPGDGIFQVCYWNKSGKDRVAVNVYDVKGNLVFNGQMLCSEANHCKVIDMKDKPKGTYLVEVISGPYRRSRKIILN